MHVRRHMNRFFSSLRRPKSKEKVPIDVVEDSREMSNESKFQSFRRSLRLKRSLKRKSTSRSFLLDDQINDEDDFTSDKENPRDNNNKGENLKVTLSAQQKPFHAQVDICPNISLLRADEDEDVDRILFDHHHHPTSNALGKIPERIPKDTEVNDRREELARMSRTKDGITFRPVPLPNNTQMKCSACIHRENKLLDSTASNSENNKVSRKEREEEKDPGNCNLPAVPPSSGNCNVSAVVIKNTREKLTLGEFRRSAKQVRKSMKKGFVNWAQSMSYQYATAVIPEFYECPSNTIDCHYDRTEAPWFPHHYYHFGVKEPRSGSSLHPNSCPNHLCHCSL